ncbi:MATE family efflux transporter [uncultured Muribaculum sp.]|uniref:MATE family efflux transporter n=1 Tax=uncultured Muribaculum sp. TaxID=1918613 RepID=UPI0025980274|nr:MATE family efflux transporter [uncultured Muribaculum sp.]
MERDKLDFGNGKINRLFRAMFFPTLIGMAFNSALNICDGMFVGHGVGSNALAAINIVAPLFLICTGIGLMFGIGASVIGGIRLAEGNVKAARIIMTQAYIAGAVIFGIVILASLLFTRPVLYMLGCSPALEELATDYLLWLLPGLVFFYLQCAGMMLIRLDGSPRYAMSVQIVAAILNIFLDWYMVFPLDLGIKGASMATSISCIVAGVMVVAYFIFFSDKLKFYKLRLTMKSLKLSIRNTGYMAKIGFATFIAEVAIGVMMVAGNYMFLSYLGEAGVAAFSVGCYLFPLIFSISNAVAQSSQPIISYNYGSGQRQRVRQALNVALLTACACGVIISAGMWTGSGILTAIFLDSADAAYGIATTGLPLLGLCALPFALNITFIGYYQSCEQSTRAITYMMLRGIIFMAPGFILLPHLIGTSGLWLAIPLSELLTLAVIVASYLLTRHRHPAR